MGHPENTETPDSYEARYKAIQSHTTKVSQENAVLKAKLEALSTVPKVQIQVSEQEQLQLDALLDTDPDAWRVRYNALEEQANTAYASKVDEITTTKLREQELASRSKILDAYIKDSNSAISETSLDEIPLRLQKQLESGEVTYTEFLEQADNYLKQGTQIANPTTLQGASLGDVGSSAGIANNTPTTNYTEIIF